MSKEPEAPSEFTPSATAQGDIASGARDHTASPLPSPSFTRPSADECTGSFIPTSAAGVQHVDTECEPNPAEPRAPAEEPMEGSDGGIQTEGAQTAAAKGRGRYEYMDIRRCDSTEGEDSAHGGSPESAKSPADVEVVDLSVEDQWVEEEQGECHKANKQPSHCGEVSGAVKARPDALKGAGEKVEEYEEMTRAEATPTGWEQANYQNFPLKTNAGNEEADGDRCVGIGDYIKVCAVVGDPGGNTSFDNPDYWHSRLFLKPDAVRT